MKKFAFLLIGLIAGFVLGMFVRNKSSTEESIKRVETVWDTIPYRAPIAQSELATGTHLYRLPTYCFAGTGSGGEPRLCGSKENDIDLPDTTITVPTYGTGAGGEPRLCTDSAIVELPMIQRHYADSTYEAWVSGPLDPQLDSINVFRPTTIITKQEWKPPKKWHIGVSAGYGYGPKGFQPYIGMGLTYSIWSF